MQRTIQKPQKVEHTEEESVDTTEVKSSEVVEAANCCLSSIDELLDEIVEELPSWHPDADYDPSDKKPPPYDYLRSRQWANDHLLNESEFDIAVWVAWKNRSELWHDLRGLSFDPCSC